MLGTLASPLDSTARFRRSTPYVATATPITTKLLNVNSSSGVAFPNTSRRSWTTISVLKKRVLHSTAQTSDITLSDEYEMTWQACRQALLGFEFSVEEEDKILGKAFGRIHSCYWGEDREEETPKFEAVTAVLEYLRSLGLSDNDLGKVLKKFPEVLGCSLDGELKTNVAVLEKEWGIKGRSMRNLLLRNPKVLGYNVDCKGDCMAKCTRCWVRF